MNIIKDIKKEYSELVQSTKNYAIPLNRITGFIELKYRLGMHPTGYTYTPYVVSLIDTSHTIYSSLYWRDNKPLFACISGAFESSKGEFRDNFCNYTQIVYVFNKYGDILNPLVDTLLKEYRNKSIKVDYGVYTGKGGDVPDPDGADMTMIGIRLLALAGFIIAYRRYGNNIILKAHKTYNMIFNKIIKIDGTFIVKNFEKCKKIYQHIYRNGEGRPFGQKLTPLTVGEVIYKGDIMYSPWRELIITYAVSDMVLNFICPSFALGSSWTLIEGTDETMIDNLLVKDRISKNYKVKTLLKEYKRLYALTEKVENVEPYRERLKYEIDNINNDKIISKITLVKVDENVGYTIGALIYSTKYAKTVNPQFHGFLTNIDIFNKYIFDLLYATHVLHSKVGVINFDLHINNLTIMKSYSFYTSELGTDKIKTYRYNKSKRYNSEYKIDGVSYYFPFDGFYGAIIDYSDSIINEQFLEYADKFVERQDFDKIIEREKDIIFNKISGLLAFASKHPDKIKASIISNYERTFRAITGIDFVTILRKLRCAFEAELSMDILPGAERKFYVNEDIVKRLIYLEEYSLEFLLKSLQQVLDKPNIEVPLPGDVLLPKFFSNYTTNNKEIWEVWNYNTKPKYSVSSYKTYPPWTKKDELIKKYGESETNEFISGDYISDDLKTQDTHLDFILETLEMER